MQGAYAFTMENEDQEPPTESLRRARRRRRLIALLKEVRSAAGGAPHDNADDLRGIVSVVARDESERTYLQAIVSGKRGLGDTKAAALEKRYGKVPGWFDAEAEASFWPFSLELQEQVLNLEPEDLHFMEVAMWTHLKKQVPPQLSYMDSDERPSNEVQKPSTIVSPRSSAQEKKRKTA